MAVSKELVNQAIKQLTDTYDLKGGKIDATDKGDYILLVLNGSGYTIYPTDERDIEDIISFIVADQNLQPHLITKVEEGIKEDYLNRNSGYILLEDVANFITDYYDFEDIDDKYDCIDSILSDYKDEGKISYENLNQYIGGHNGTDKASEGLTNPSNVMSAQVSESDTATVSTLVEDYPALLIALDSEKDAEITYKTLIEIEESSDKPNQQVIDLLEKILADEKEHIALLSALSASNNSDYVAEDSQEQFNEYVDNIITN